MIDFLRGIMQPIPEVAAPRGTTGKQLLNIVDTFGLINRLNSGKPIFYNTGELY